MQQRICLQRCSILLPLILQPRLPQAQHMAARTEELIPGPIPQSVSRKMAPLLWQSHARSSAIVQAIAACTCC